MVVILINLLRTCIYDFAVILIKNRVTSFMPCQFRTAAA